MQDLTIGSEQWFRRADVNKRADSGQRHGDAGSNGNGFRRPSPLANGRSATADQRPLRLLLVEDDRMLSDSLERVLEAANFNLYVTARGADAIELAQTYRFDLALLDISLPDVDGHSVLEAFRRDRPEMPVIILSGSDSLDSKLSGFEQGADDYVTKPFQVDELVARIHAVLRRLRAGSPTQAHVGPVILDFPTRHALVEGAPVPLTAKEYACLEFLVSRRGSTVTKEMFLAHLYAGRNEPEMKIIDVFICKLRRKLSEAGAPGVIDTVWGRGYTIPAG